MGGDPGAEVIADDIPAGWRLSATGAAWEAGGSGGMHGAVGNGALEMNRKMAYRPVI